MICVSDIDASDCVAMLPGVETLAEMVQRLRAGKPMERVARDAGLTKDAIWRIETGRASAPRWDTLNKLAGVFGIDVKDLIAARDQTEPSLPDDIEPAPAQPINIPEWDCEIAAGDWLDASMCQLDAEQQRAIVARGLFIVRVRGDSMTPHYKSGARVMFQIVRLDEGGPIKGRDYYWQHSDGRCTLKRFAGADEDAYTLQPTNRKYKRIVLPKQELARLAVVAAILTDPPFGK